MHSVAPSITPSALTLPMSADVQLNECLLESDKSPEGEYFRPGYVNRVAIVGVCGGWSRAKPSSILVIGRCYGVGMRRS